MPSELVVERGEATLHLTGVVDIFDAAGLHAAARQMCEPGSAARATLRLAEATALDTSVVQILIALRRERERQGGELRVEGLSDRLRAELQSAGVEGEIA